MVIKCIKAGIINLTSKKEQDLRHEYEGFQRFLIMGTDEDILTYYKASKRKGGTYDPEKIHYKDHPLPLPNRKLKYRDWKTQLTPHWVRIPVRKRKGVGLWLPIKPHAKLPSFEYIRDSLLVLNHKGNFELRLIFDIPIPSRTPKEILAVDLGEKVMATVCGSTGYRAFLGREVRGIRRHYAWLRKRLGERKLLHVIQRIKHKEHNKVRNVLHHVANEIVEQAEKQDAMIVIGELKGIRTKRFSKTLNRIVFNMPYSTLTKMIQYKAQQRGIAVKMIDESFTSQMCHKCGHCEKSNRKSQGLFACGGCQIQYHADLNGAKNILKRAREQDFLAGALADAHKSVAET